MGETSLWSFLLHTSFGWEGRSFSLFDGLGWRRGAVAQGVPHFMLWSMMALVLRLPTHESGVVWGVVRGSFGGSFGCIFSTCFHLCSLFVPFFYLLVFLSQRLLLLLFSLFPSFTQSYSFSNQTIVAEWLFVMQSSAGRRVVCSARGGLSCVCYNGTLYPSNEGNPLVFWWIAVTLLWPGRGDFSASGLSTFKKIALTLALDCTQNHPFWQHDWDVHHCRRSQTMGRILVFLGSCYLKQQRLKPYIMSYIPVPYHAIIYYDPIAHVDILAYQNVCIYIINYIYIMIP